MALGAKADRTVRTKRREVDGEREAIVDVHLARRDQPFLVVKFADQRVGGKARPLAEADLRQARTLAHQDGEGARRDLGKERAFITLRHLVEFLRIVGDDAGEDVQPPGRALGVRSSGDTLGQPEALLQRHDIDAARLQHRAIGQRHAVQRQFFHTGLHRGAGPWQEGGAHAIGPGPQPEVKAGGLYLVVVRCAGKPDQPLFAIAGDGAGGQDAAGLWIGSHAHHMAEMMLAWQVFAVENPATWAKLPPCMNASPRA